MEMDIRESGKENERMVIHTIFFLKKKGNGLDWGNGELGRAKDPDPLCTHDARLV